MLERPEMNIMQIYKSFHMNDLQLPPPHCEVKRRPTKTRRRPTKTPYRFVKAQENSLLAYESAVDEMHRLNLTDGYVSRYHAPNDRPGGFCGSMTASFTFIWQELFYDRTGGSTNGAPWQISHGFEFLAADDAVMIGVACRNTVPYLCGYFLLVEFMIMVAVETVH